MGIKVIKKIFITHSLAGKTMLSLNHLSRAIAQPSQVLIGRNTVAFIQALCSQLPKQHKVMLAIKKIAHDRDRA